MLSGELILPRSWNIEKPEIIARSIGWTDGPTEDETANDAHREIERISSNADVDVYRWTIGQLAPGRYEVCCAWPPHVVEATLTKEGTAGVVLEVPPPCTMVVSVLDSQTKVPVKVEPAFMAFAIKRKDGSVLPLWPGGAEWDGKTQTYTMRSVPGDQVLRCSGLGTEYGFATARATIRPGENEVTILIAKIPRLRVSLADEAGSVMPNSHAPQLQPVSGAGQVCGLQRTDKVSYIVTVSEAGRYRLTLPHPPTGYEVPAEQVVDIAPGTMTEVVIRLTKKP